MMCLRTYADGNIWTYEQGWRKLSRALQSSPIILKFQDAIMLVGNEKLLRTMISLTNVRHRDHVGEQGIEENSAFMCLNVQF
jgi:hypothetical protein